MNNLSRRRFLKLSAGATAASVLTPAIARAAAIEGNHRTRSIRDIEHIVVLMQENRSFDHYFGTMRGVRGFGDPHPATLPSGKRCSISPTARTRCFRSIRTCPTRVSRSWRISTTVGKAATTHSTTAATTSGCRSRVRPTMAHLTRKRHPVPLRAGRRVHAVRCLPLLAARPDRSEPVLLVDGQLRRRRPGRRTGHRERRNRLLVDVPIPSGCSAPA